MKKIQEKIENQLKSQLPFVVYNKPNMKEVVGMFQNNNDVFTITNEFDTKGFVFAPFDATNKTVVIPLANSKIIKDVFVSEAFDSDGNFFSNQTSKSVHISLVEKGIAAIKKEQFKKVVLSRKEKVILDKLAVFETYCKLLQAYPNAFVYVWFHPKVGLWFGATPETLVKLENNNFTTMALAGTQVYKENEHYKWHKKEIDEQKFVTEYIVSKLAGFSKGLNISEAETVRAGSLLHLRTQINGELDTLKADSLYSLVDLLHPTPAVCGFPKAPSKQFILDNENYNRSYYTGFLGELNMGNQNNNDSHLFVNLRCMEVVNTDVYIYVGGGITKDSIPLKEWEETVAKSTIMKKIL